MAALKKKKRGKILVTGAGGMLGADLCAELKKYYDVIGLDVKGKFVSGTQYKQCDITSQRSTIAAVVKTKPDIIIHAAAWTAVDGCEQNPKKAERINIVGTKNVALAAEKAEALLIFISTDFVFDGRKRTPYTESDKPNPLSVYAKTKLEGEKIISRLKKNIIIRTSWLFGRNGDNFVKAILRQAKNMKAPLKVVNDQRGSPTYTKDLAAAIARLLKVCEGRGSNIFHISNRGVVTWFDYAREILKIRGLKKSIIPITSRELNRPAPRPKNSALNTKKFENFTRMRLRPWKSALKEYLCKEAA